MFSFMKSQDMAARENGVERKTCAVMEDVRAGKPGR
jgi:hypothetical protein